MKKYVAGATVIFLILAFIQGCKKDNSQTTSNDSALFALIGQSGYMYYVGTPGIKASAGNSPHGFERVRFNSIALAALDTTGKLMPGNSFPNGSVIVKEIYSSLTGSINQYSIMKKDPSSAVSGNGYVWAEFKSDGTSTFSSGKRGDGCISCHSGSANRDLVRIFDLH